MSRFVCACLFEGSSVEKVYFITNIMRAFKQRNTSSAAIFRDIIQRHYSYNMAQLPNMKIDLKYK